MAAKVAFLLDRYLGHGGSEGQILQLLTHIDRSRYEPAIAVLRGTDHLTRRPPPCTATVLDIPRIAHPRAAARIVRFAARLRAEGCAIVHCFFNDASLLAPPIMKTFGMRTVVSRRDMGFWQTAGTLAACRGVAPFVDRYVVNARAVRDWVAAQERVPRERIDVIYNGYVTPCAESLAADRMRADALLPRQGPIVGIVANVKPVKRIDTLVRAFARVAPRRPDAHLVVVGADSPAANGASATEELRTLAASLAIAGRVTFTGGVEQPLAFVERFDVAVLCSESEGLSNAVIEYMAAGKPVICTDTGGNPELVRDGVNGFLVPVGDDAALAERVLALLADSALAARLGAAGSALVDARHSHLRMVDEQMACYDRLLATRGRRSLSATVQAE